MRHRFVRKAFAACAAVTLGAAALVVACSSSSAPGIYSSSFAKDAAATPDTGILSIPDSATDAGRVEPTTKIAAGALHACAIVGGVVKCWGDNGQGQIGAPADGAHLPTPISGISFTPTMLDGTAFHVCASDGTQTICWGEDNDDEIGQVSTDDVCPLEVCPPTAVPLGSINALSLGDGHTCFISAAKTVGCLGDDYYGVLGNASDGGFTTTPITIEPLADVVQLVSGGQYLCALTSDGKVWCWGDNRVGQLGQGNGGPDSGFNLDPNPTPVQVPGITAIALSAGAEDSTCAILTDHTVACWGYDATQNYTVDGQLGHDPANDPMCNQYPCDPKPTIVPGLRDVREVTTGFHQTCAVKMDDTVVCFGDDTYGQLQTAPTIDGGTGAPYDFTPQVMPGLVNVAHLSSGYNFVCAVTFDNHVSCWGDNSYGQLGVPIPTSGPTFLEIPVTPEGL